MRNTIEMYYMAQRLLIIDKSPWKIKIKMLRLNLLAKSIRSKVLFTVNCRLCIIPCASVGVYLQIGRKETFKY